MIKTYIYIYLERMLSGCGWRYWASSEMYCGGSSYQSFNLSDIHFNDPLWNKRNHFHGSSLEGYQLISSF